MPNRVAWGLGVNAQRPTPNVQRPTSNVQRPTSNGASVGWAGTEVGDPGCAPLGSLLLPHRSPTDFEIWLGAGNRWLVGVSTSRTLLRLVCDTAALRWRAILSGRG